MPYQLQGTGKKSFWLQQEKKTHKFTYIIEQDMRAMRLIVKECREI